MSTPPLSLTPPPPRSQEAATQEKFVLEEAQRAAAKERKASGAEWVPKYFAQVRTQTRRRCGLSRPGIGKKDDIGIRINAI